MTPEEIARLPYRPCVGIMLLDRTGRIFVARRNDMAGDAWQMPQGGIDEGETPADAALRELEEEIGTAAVRILGETDGWLKYDLPHAIVPTTWKGRYRGQAQKWFAMAFLGDEAEIAPETVAHPEFDAWRWVGPDELPALAVDFKRQVYRDVLAEFQSLIERLRLDAL